MFGKQFLYAMRFYFWFLILKFVVLPILMIVDITSENNVDMHEDIIIDLAILIPMDIFNIVLQVSLCRLIQLV